jgi:type I restriction enzyme S subunit
VTTVSLGEVVDFYSGGTPSKSKPELWQGNVPWFSAKDMKRPRLRDSADHVADAVFTSTPLRRLPAGTIAMVVRGMILAHTVPISILDVDAAINQDLKALIPKRDLDTSFLAAMLRAQQATILSQVSTAAHGTKKLDSRVLENIRIPFPPLAEQRRIAAILDHAAALRDKRRQVLAHLGALTQSIFNDMFGNTAERARLKDMGVDFISGKNVLGNEANAHPVNRVIKVSAISGGNFVPSESKPMPRDYSPPTAHQLRRGDILFGRASGSLELLGATAVVDVHPKDLYLPDKVWRLSTSPDGPVDKGYILGVLRSSEARAFIRHNASGAAGVRNIGKARLLEYLAPLPSLDLQQDFAARVELINEQHTHVQRGLARDDELFSSLQSRAFRGEL